MKQTDAAYVVGTAAWLRMHQHPLQRPIRCVTCGLGDRVLDGNGQCKYCNGTVCC